MSDQRRWFKLWASALADDHLQRLPVADRWAWVALGAYTKVHGERGVVVLSESNKTLAAAMGIDATELRATVTRLPHVHVSENRHGEFTVTWRNWMKYQEDSTLAERAQRSRTKKRREENKKRSPLNPPTQPARFPTSEIAHDNGSNPEPIIEPTPDDKARHASNQAGARRILRQAFPHLDPPESGSI